MTPTPWAQAVEAMRKIPHPSQSPGRCDNGPCDDCLNAYAEACALAALPHLLRGADEEVTDGPCVVVLIGTPDGNEWELWCDKPRIGAAPNGRYRLATFGSVQECRAVCNALNRVHARALAAAAGRVGG